MSVSRQDVLNQTGLRFAEESISCIVNLEKEEVTIKVQKYEDLWHVMSISKELYEENSLDVPLMVSRRWSRRRDKWHPYETKLVERRLEHHGSTIPRPPHLFPKQPSQIKASFTTMSEPKQTNKHGEKEGDIGNRDGSDR